MDYYKNADKWGNRNVGLSYNQITTASLDIVATEPVTLSEVKEWCKVEGSADDAILSALIIAARDICERYTNVSFVQRGVIAMINNVNGRTFLPFGPVSGDVDVYNEDGTATTGTFSDTADGFVQILTPLQIVRCEYTGGYSALPEGLKTALKMQVLFMYENRGDSQQGISPIAAAVLNPYKRV